MDWDMWKHTWKLTWQHRLGEFLKIIGGFAVFFGLCALAVQTYIWAWQLIVYLAAWPGGVT